MFNDLFKLELKCLSRILLTFDSLNSLCVPVSDEYCLLTFGVLCSLDSVIGLLVQKTSQFRLVIQQLILAA